MNKEVIEKIVLEAVESLDTEADIRYEIVDTTEGATSIRIVAALIPRTYTELVYVPHNTKIMEIVADFVDCVEHANKVVLG